MFTGAGSKTDAYFPEVTVVCPLCLVDCIGKEPEEIDGQLLCDSINSKVLEFQSADRFMKPFSWKPDLDASLQSMDKYQPNSDSNDEDDTFVNPFNENCHEAQNQEEFSWEDDLLHNPFFSQDKDCQGSTRSFHCSSCQLSFSMEDLLSFHNEVFHREPLKRDTVKRRLTLDFVEEGNELITTFCNPRHKQSRRDKVTLVKNSKARISKPVKKYVTRSQMSQN